MYKVDGNYSVTSVGTDGYHIRLNTEEGNEVAELLIWPTNEPKKVRVNWVMVIKKYQNSGKGKELLEYLKRNIKEYFPEAENIIFQNVTSLGMLRLAERVFGTAAVHRHPDLPKYRLERPIDLPEKSPAKYNIDGGCRIDKMERMESFIIPIKQI